MTQKLFLYDTTGVAHDERRATLCLRSLRLTCGSPNARDGGIRKRWLEGGVLGGRMNTPVDRIQNVLFLRNLHFPQTLGSVRINRASTGTLGMSPVRKVEILEKKISFSTAKQKATALWKLRPIRSPALLFRLRLDTGAPTCPRRTCQDYVGHCLRSLSAFVLEGSSVSVIEGREPLQDIPGLSPELSLHLPVLS